MIPALEAIQQAYERLSVFMLGTPLAPLLFKVLLQVGLLLLGLFWLYRTLARQAFQASRLLRGVVIAFVAVIALWSLTRLFELPILETVLTGGLQLLFVALIVIFQPELRRLLIALGQGEWAMFSPIGRSSKPEHLEAIAVRELAEAIRYLSKSKIGALIVLEPISGQGAQSAYLEAGTPIDAKLSTELLLTIFHPSAPLHDGALVIDPMMRVSAAGVLLPLTEDPGLSWRYGTRHRAAIGLSEMSECQCLVVSEETGSCSFVARGQIQKLEDFDEVLARLERFYGVSHDEVSSAGPALKRRAGLGLAKPVSANSTVGERLFQWFDVDSWTETWPSGWQKFWQNDADVAAKAQTLKRDPKSTQEH
ncbi:MAG: diadenylate cyclase [Vampirovibrionales bacterium]|nr:diadenylate cyclase [Vampirovibrionales bacterium]